MLQTVTNFALKGCRMQNTQHASIIVRRSRMVFTSLVVAIVVAALLLTAGSSALAVAGVAVTALSCSLLCARSLSQTVAEIRAHQSRVVASLQLTEDVSFLQGE